MTTKRKRTCVKHGLCFHNLYRVWDSMRYRCNNKNAKAYHLYGSKGITVCEDWLFEFVNFYQWAMSNGYKNGLQLDRKDNNGNYNPYNCRFVTRKTNCQNRRNSMRWYLFGNEFESCTDAAKYYNVVRGTISKWCNGFKRYGKLYPPKDGCWSELKYKGGNH